MSKKILASIKNNVIPELTLHYGGLFIYTKINKNMPKPSHCIIRVTAGVDSGEIIIEDTQIHGLHKQCQGLLAAHKVIK